MNNDTKIFHGREYYAIRSMSSQVMPFNIMVSTTTSIIELNYFDSQYVLTEWVERK